MERARTRSSICVLTSLMMVAALAVEVRAGEPADTGTVLLSAGSLWRKHYTFIPPAVSEATAKELAKSRRLKPDDPALATKVLFRSMPRSVSKKMMSDLRTAPPPTGWMQPGFEDGGWIQRPGVDLSENMWARSRPYHTAAGLRKGDTSFPALAHIAQRGRFIVRDPARLKTLALRLTYRGGFVAWLNGVEIARAHVPNGAVTCETPADDCGPKTNEERTSGPIAIKPGLIKAGVNVLTLSLHRSEYSAYARQKQRGKLYGAVGLAELVLTADTPAGNVVSAVRPAAGFRVWAAETWRAILDTQHDDPAEAPRPLRIAAARNERFSGQVVVTSTAPVEGLTATLSALQGPGAIPADRIRIRFAAVNPMHPETSRYHRNAYFTRPTGVGGRRFDMLVDKAPATIKPLDVAKSVGGYEKSYLPARNAIRAVVGLPAEVTPRAVQPVWITVNVPEDAKAGVYKGTLTVTAKGERAAVPVELDVADWTAPDAKDHASVLFIYQSPETLAHIYKVERWSEKHWALIERSLKLMGEAGNIGLIFPLCARTCMGNPEGWITWVKQDDGTLKPDYTIFDRYLATALKHHAPEQLKVVSLNVWGYENRIGRGAKVAYGSRITVLDPKTGKKTAEKAPALCTPESMAMWKPVVLALRDRLKAKGLAGRIMFGFGGDSTPSSTHIGMFNAILPGTPWARDSHFNTNSYRWAHDGKKGSVPVGYNSIVWGGKLPDPDRKRYRGWQVNPRHIVLSFNRYGVSLIWLKGYPDPWSFRMLMEATLTTGRNGCGRIGGDYFRVDIDLTKRWKEGGRTGRVASPSKGGSGGTLFGSYPWSGVAQIGLGNNTADLFAPGLDGPVSTVRFENLRMGVLEAEARAVIEKAIRAKTIPEGLAKECQTLLDARTRAFRTWRTGVQGATTVKQSQKIPFGAQNWHESTRTLFELAGKVVKAAKLPVVQEERMSQ